MPVPPFRLLVVPGVTVDKWSRMWAERLPAVHLELTPIEAAEATTRLRTDADAGLVRLPMPPDDFHAIPLYTETTVVVASRDHVIAAADEITVADLADEPILLPVDDVLAWPGTHLPDRPATTAAAVELAAAGVGVLLVPQSLARLHHRRDLVYRPLTDAPSSSSVGLAWSRDNPNELVEEMIGIVRGRTANSTRGRQPAPERPATQPPRRRKR